MQSETPLPVENSRENLISLFKINTVGIFQLRLTMALMTTDPAFLSTFSTWSLYWQTGLNSVGLNCPAINPFWFQPS